MNPLQSCIKNAVHAQIQDSNFSFRSPSIAHEVWINIQDAPDSVCEEFVLVGEHVLRTCFLSLMLKRDLARPNGFFTTVRDIVLSPNVYSALVSRAGLQWRGPNTRPAADVFLIFVAALHTSLANYVDVLDWFREIFFPLLCAAEERYDEYTNHEGPSEQDESPDTYVHALDFLAQIKVIQSQWKAWNGAPAKAFRTSGSLQKLILSASSFAGKGLGSMTGMAIALAGNVVRASVPLKWVRKRKFNDPLRREIFKRRASSILDPRPTLSRANSEASEVLPTPAFQHQAAPSPPPDISQATVTPPSNVCPFRYSTSARPKEPSPAPPPLILPRKGSYGLRETSWSESGPLDSSCHDFF